MSNDVVPVVQDVTFRLSATGDMIGLDFECRDGQTRALALSVAALPKVMAGFLWAGAESGARRPPPVVTAPMREALEGGARALTGYRVVATANGQDRLLELRSGAAVLCVQVSAEMATEIAHALFGGGVKAT
jgi:hypothetical protein